MPRYDGTVTSCTAPHRTRAGQCGRGPNIAIMPQGVILQGIKTPQHMMQVLETYCHVTVSHADVAAATVIAKHLATLLVTTCHSCACKAMRQRGQAASTWRWTSTRKPSNCTPPTECTSYTPTAVVRGCRWVTRKVP